MQAKASGVERPVYDVCKGDTRTRARVKRILQGYELRPHASSHQ